jgi:hypothetical protein
MIKMVLAVVASIALLVSVGCAGKAPGKAPFGKGKTPIVTKG